MAVDSMYEYAEEIFEPDFPGPLMRSEMEKEDLIWYIQCKVERCLALIDQPEKVEEYIFWKIMELFCLQNGRVMRCEIAAILFQSYSLLKNITGEDTEWKDWLLPLALLLCSATPDDENRDAIIKMGDDLDSIRLTYAAHICYVVAKVELGMHSGFELIGYNSVPFGLNTFYQAFKRTETYEYMLSLTSGHAQPNFQSYKLSHASRTAFIYCLNTAFKYCETIARSALAFPDVVTRSFIERVISLTCKIQENELYLEEPDWLIELCLLHKTKLPSAAKLSYAYPEENIQQTGSEGISETEDCGCSMVTSEHRDDESSDLEQDDDQMDVYKSRYSMGELLREEGFAKVHAGVRIADGKEVAIKTVEKDKHDTRIIPGETEELPLEVALLKMVCKPPQCKHVLELLEWFDLGSEYVLILECPGPFFGLWDFINDGQGYLPEAQVRDIMLQVVQAARHCCERGVVHLDIKPETILINPETLQIKLIDFGCGALLQDSPFDKYTGDVMPYAPPEWSMDKLYMGIPATVWGLAVLLFNLLTGEYPFHTEEDFYCMHQALHVEVSEDCIELTTWCLELIPESRPTLDDLLRHEWFTEAGPEQSPDSS